MEKKVSMYFVPVKGCDNTWCQLYKGCSFSGGEIHHMDITLLNDILRDCFSNMRHIQRLYFAVKGNSQIYIHAKELNLGGFSSRCIMSFTYPYPTDNFPTNMGKTYRIDTMNDVKYLMSLPDFWDREITKLYTVVSKKNIDELAGILSIVSALRGRRTFLYTVNSIRLITDLWVDEATILPLLRKYQYIKIREDHMTSCRKNDLNITVDYLGQARLGEQPEIACKWTNFNDVYKRISKAFYTSKKCVMCLSKPKAEWRYAIL